MNLMRIVRWSLIFLSILFCSSVSFSQDSSLNKQLQQVQGVVKHYLKVDTSVISKKYMVEFSPPLSGSCRIPSSCYFDRAGYKKYEYNKKRVRLVTIGNIVGYGGALIGLNAAWYSNYPRSKFHFFNDNAEWLQVDKVGHAYSAYLESVYSHELWRWAGLPRKKRIWIGGLSGMAYQSIIEVLDGFSAEYGFSWGDFAANAFGSGMFISQQLAWDEQKIKFKFSFHHIDYGDAVLNARADILYGQHEYERFLKDYNAQTLWWSVDVKTLIPKAEIPSWIALAVGYGAEGMFGARSNVWKDKDGNVIDRSNIKRYRQWFLSPDIDLSKIRTNKRGIRLLLNALNVFKFPMPSVEFSDGSIKGHWIHF